MKKNHRGHSIFSVPSRVIYKATCSVVCATNTRTRREEYNFPHFPRVFSSAERIHGDDALMPPAKRPNDALCMRACIRCRSDPVHGV